MEWEKQGLLTEAAKSGQEQRLAFEKMTAGQRVKTVAGSLAEMTASTANNSKTMFNINKAAALAQAAIALPTSVLETYKAHPFPLSIAMGGAQLAAGMSQLNQIKSASFGGGGRSPTAPSATAPTVPSAIGGGSGGGGSSREIVVSGVNPNDIFSGSQLVDLINRAQRDGAVVMRFA
jgi:hypothetical protein